MVEYMSDVIHVDWPYKSKISIKKKNKQTTTTTTTSYTETDHSESNTAGESNFPALKTNNVASQNIHKETSSDGKTDQPEKDVIEHLSNTKIHTNLKQIWMHH